MNNQYGVVASNGFCTMGFSDWGELDRDEAEYVAEKLRDDGFEAKITRRGRDESAPHTP